MSASNSASSVGVAPADRRGRGFERGVELVGDARRRAARAVDPCGRGRERGAQFGQRAGERARPGEVPAREPRGQARHLGRVTVGDEGGFERVERHRLEIDALAPRADGREQIVGRAGDEKNNRARRRFFQRLQHRVRRLVLVAAQPLRLEQHEHLAIGLDRRAARLGQDALAHVLVDEVRETAGLELDDVGMQTAQHQAADPLVAVGCHQLGGEAARRDLDTGAGRPDEEIGVPGPRRGVLERLDRPLLPDQTRPHRHARRLGRGCDNRSGGTQSRL